MSEQSESQEPKHLCELAITEIQELRAAGIEPTLDEVVWINDLAREVDNPYGGENRRHAGKPSKAGNVWLWPFTIQARIWYQQAVEWFDGSLELQGDALAFALAHGREAGAFVHLAGYKSAKKAVCDWKSRLACTDDELSAAILDVMPMDDELAEIEARFNAEYNAKHNITEDEKPGKDFDWDESVDLLIATTGLPRDVWMREESEARALSVINVIIKQQLAMAGGKQRLDAGDPYIVAVKRLGLAIREIKRRHSQGAQNGVE
jgi:hypothetical protein